MMIGLRPMLSDSQPKKTKKPVPRSSAIAIMMLTDTSVHLEHVLQEEQSVELAIVPDHGLTCRKAEQRQ